MLRSTLFTSVLALALAASVNAHAGFEPFLGVAGTPARSDVQRPSTASPCGTINIANTLDTSTAAAASAAGAVALTAIDFNAGADGSRSIKTAQVDPTGTGKSFVAATVTTNGNAAPATVGTDAVTVQLPAGTKCTGGKAGNLCLLSLTSTAGFGNCVAVSQGAAAASTGAAATGAAAGAAGAAAGAAAGKATGAKKAGAAKTGAAKKAGAKAAKKAAAKPPVARSWRSRNVHRRSAVVEA
ncbi:hypothetical protein FA95DRAFT_1571387 [Auriscalpium vulgare]|uniref:Uncharacterized protein n=1 Tax=Auriscalpium vulgare TaxID=40419 RepID=A0ACB8RYR5_9AGAM|nr:hypothetical protein FA95DRAFT_1571387 [Auriscalpium vulgare]